MKQALRVAGRTFTTGRMVKEYAERYYVPAVQGIIEGDDPPSDDGGKGVESATTA
jgi:hypothetical protein